MEEKMLKHARGTQLDAVCTKEAPHTLGPYVVLKLSAHWLAKSASASACAAWKMPRRNRPSMRSKRMASETAPRSEASQRIRRTSARQSANQSQSRSLPLTIRSLRDVSTICCAPPSTSNRAVSSPRPPSPPEKRCAPLLLTFRWLSFDCFEV